MKSALSSFVVRVWTSISRLQCLRFSEIWRFNVIGHLIKQFQQHLKSVRMYMLKQLILFENFLRILKWRRNIDWNASHWQHICYRFWICCSAQFQITNLFSYQIAIYRHHFLIYSGMRIMTDVIVKHYFSKLAFTTNIFCIGILINAVYHD